MIITVIKKAMAKTSFYSQSLSMYLKIIIKYPRYCLDKYFLFNYLSDRRSNMTPWDNNFWLDVNYLQMAKAAQYCSAHCSTVLLAEIWCDLQR